MDAFWDWLGSIASPPFPRTKATSVNENSNSTMSFDRMRNMLTRAAEIRESEQQQVFDALDEIHARLAPLESLGPVRKRLSELPDRNEVSVLAERLDEAMGKLEAQDSAIAAVARTVEAVVDRLATPFAQLDGRLDGMGGRLEGVVGRMDGLEDKLANIHRRIDSLDGHLDKQDGKLDTLPGSVYGPTRERIEAMETALRGRLDEVDEGVHEHLDGTKDALHRTVTESADATLAAVKGSTDAVRHSLTETGNALHGRLDETRDTVNATRDSLHSSLSDTRNAVHGKLDDARNALNAALAETRETMDASDRLEALAQRLEQVTARLDEMATRLDTVEDGFAARLGEMGGSIEQSLTKVEGSLANRPDSDTLASVVRKSNEESERRIGGQLDEAMATFAELMMGGGPAMPAAPPSTLPRQQRRATRKPSKAVDKRDDYDDSSDDS